MKNRKKNAFLCRNVFIVIDRLVFVGFGNNVFDFSSFFSDVYLSSFISPKYFIKFKGLQYRLLMVASY